MSRVCKLLCKSASPVIFFFFFNDTATTEIYTLSLHDALPIYANRARAETWPAGAVDAVSDGGGVLRSRRPARGYRSEEHTSELQSQSNLVCRLLLEKKKKPYVYSMPIAFR